jgi:hypothetical protein
LTSTAGRQFTFDPVDHVDAGGLGGETKAASGVGSASRTVWSTAFAVSAAASAADCRDRYVNGSVALVWFAEHPWQCQRVAGLLHQLVDVHLRLLSL